MKWKWSSHQLLPIGYKFELQPFRQVQQFMCVLVYISSRSASAAVTKLSFWNISETIKSRTFNIYLKVALDGLDISTGHDAISYFLWAANRINVFALGNVQVAIYQ